MADHFYGINLGGGLDPSGVTFGTVTASKNVELRVTDGVTGINKTEVLKALEAIKARVEKNDAPA